MYALAVIQTFPRTLRSLQESVSLGMLQKLSDLRMDEEVFQGKAAQRSAERQNDFTER